MGYLIDTNVISEMRKGMRAHPALVEWSSRVLQREMFLSVLVVGEVRRGIELLRRRDMTQAAGLDAWFASVLSAFQGRTLPVDQPVAEAWAQLSVPDRLPLVDGLLAATATVHQLTLVTRNTKDVIRTGVRVINPFEPQPTP